MASRESSEVKEMVAELRKQGFDALRAEFDRFQAQMYYTKPYQQDLLAGMSPTLSTQIAVPSARLQTEAEEVQGLLNRTLGFHDIGRGDTPTDRKNEDKRELYFAHQFHKFNRGGRLRNHTHRWQTVGPYALWWLDILPFSPDQRDDYELADLQVINALSAYFLTDDAGTPTVSARHYKVPYVKFGKQYLKAKDDTEALKLCREEFKGIRGGTGRPENSTGFGQEIEVWVCDNGVEISHHVKISDDEFKQYGDDGKEDNYPNHIGRNSLFIITGIFNHDAQELEHRYKGLLSALGRSQKNVDVVTSHLVSTSASPPKWMIEANNEVTRSKAESDNWDMPPVEFQDDIAYVFGRPQQMWEKIGDGLREALPLIIGERDAMLSTASRLHQGEVIEKTTAAAYLRADEALAEKFDSAQSSEIAGVVDVCNALEYAIVNYLNKPGQDARATETAKITVVGTLSGYKVAGKSLEQRKGEQLEVGPETFKGKHELEVMPIADKQSEKVQQYDLRRQQLLDGAITRAELQEAITDDVTGHILKLDEEARYQKLEPLITNLDFVAALEAIKLRSDNQVDLTLLAQQAGLLPGAPPSPPRVNPNGTNGMTTSDGMNVAPTAVPPPTQVPNTGSQQF